MDAFIQRHKQDVIGVVSGFDRLRFRGTLCSICYAEGVDRFLGRVGVRYKDFKEFALGLSEGLVEHARQVAQQAGRPFVYVASSHEDKQAVAQSIAERDGVTEGRVCVLRCLESCQSFAIRQDGKGGLRFRLEERHWERWLKTLATRVNPLLGRDSGLDLHPYYWSLSESEYATDVMFRDTAALQRVYPALLNHAIQRFARADVAKLVA